MRVVVSFVCVLCTLAGCVSSKGMAGALQPVLEPPVQLAKAANAYEAESGGWPHAMSDLELFAIARNVPLDSGDFESVEFSPHPKGVEVHYRLNHERFAQYGGQLEGSLSLQSSGPHD